MLSGTHPYRKVNISEMSILAYICTTDDNYGMHKCDNLPHYKNATVECKLTVEEARYKEGCVDWNQV